MNRIFKHILTTYIILLPVIAASIIGCNTLIHTTHPTAYKRQVTLNSAVKSGWARHNQQRTQEGHAVAKAKQSSASAGFTPRWELYRINVSVLLEPGECEGKAVCELKETYRRGMHGTHTIRLEGVAETGPIPLDTIEVAMEIIMEVYSSANNQRVAHVHKTIHPGISKVDGQCRLWLSPADQLEPLKIEMESHNQYLVHTRLTLTAKNISKVNYTKVSVDGEFRLIVENQDQTYARGERTKSLAHKLIELWANERPESAEDSRLQDAANSLARLYQDEAAGYVDIHAPRDNRRVCHEHARTIREWYEVRMTLDPNLARWFRMTTIRRVTPLLWQSSNLITPNVNKLPKKWLDDETGIVLEPRVDTTGGFYGRYITAGQFRLMGTYPRIQKTAQSPSLSNK